MVPLLNSSNIAKTAIGMGGAALISPVAIPLAVPVLHGLAGIAMVGLGIFSVGSLVAKAASVINSKDNPFNQKAGQGKTS